MLDMMIKSLLPADFDMNKEIENLKTLAVKIHNAAAQLQRIESKLDLILDMQTITESETPDEPRTEDRTSANKGS